jgi:hypothetical protein
MSATSHLAILDAAETLAYIYGDTETAHRLQQLASEVQYAEGDSRQSTPLPICSVCGGDVDTGPRTQCRECGFDFSA